MRYSAEHKTEVRERIVRAAASALRAGGIDGIGIPALMKRVGLTHGGFYSHFKDRDALVSAAVTAAAEETGARVYGEGRTLGEVLDAYLSPDHLGAPMQGCVIAALGGEAPRQSAPVRRAFADAARGMLRLLDARAGNGAPAPAPSDAALVRASLMVGAVVLGRLVQDPALAARILAAARRAADT